mmetsp:Transcript_6059/g.9152  ORF Transcript_6059/g.9152 Transcript_6059/m.9152 type:complete len:173 (+) Transcript_6059:50-568(+)
MMRFIPRSTSSFMMSKWYGAQARKVHSKNISAYRHEIVNIMHEFMWCIDKNEPERFADLFTDTGTVLIAKTGTSVTGRDNLMELCSGLHQRFAPALHFESNIVLDISCDSSASNKSYWYAVLGGDIISTGFHYDQFATTTDINGNLVWKFNHRIVEHHWTKSGGHENYKQHE